MYKITFIAAIVIICVNSALASLPGSGTEQDPYRIESLADFNEFAADANYWDDYTLLETDVNLMGITYTTAVIAPDTNNDPDSGFDGTAFTGVFDGNDHKIIGLTIDDGGAGNDFLGLFGYIGEDSQVSNLGLEGGSVSGDDFLGGLVGSNSGSISNCYSTGNVSGDEYVGGLMGSNTASLSNCYSTGDVSGDRYVGGLVGDNWGNVSNCYSTGDVGGTGSRVGGLVGLNGGNVLNCYSTGDVSGYEWVGGLVGVNVGSVSNCHSTGDVSGDWCSVGGLVGYNDDGSLSNCYSTGDVSGDNGVGGLVGQNYITSVSNCYSTGGVSGTGDDVGGLVGQNYAASVSNCHSIGDVNGTGLHVGGLVGWNDGSVSNCFWDTDTQTHGVIDSIGDNDGIVTNVAGLPTAQMQTKSTFTDAGWDFVEIWLINQWATYPVLRQEIRCDLNGDGVIDLLDFALFADHWLEGTCD